MQSTATEAASKTLKRRNQSVYEFGDSSQPCGMKAQQAGKCRKEMKEFIYTSPALYPSVPSYILKQSKNR